MSDLPRKRKIVQIAFSGIRESQSTQTNYITAALCDDGTVWHIDQDFGNPYFSWRKLPPIPQDNE